MFYVEQFKKICRTPLKINNIGFNLRGQLWSQIFYTLFVTGYISSDKINFWGACLRERSPLSTLLMAWLRLSSYDILVFENILLDCWIWTLRIWLLYDDSGRFSRGISILTRKCRSDDHFEQLWPSNSRAKRDIRWSTLLCALWAFCYSAVSL